MSRAEVREMKRVVLAHSRQGDAGSEDPAKACAIALLARSVSFGHPRLAVLRLAGAVHIGGEVPADYWHYCESVVSESKDPALRDLFDTAALRAGRQSSLATELEVSA